MASTKPYNAVMHCSALEYHAVNALGTRVISNGLYINTTLFPAPPVALAGLTGFQAANTKLTSLIGLAKGNSNNVDARDEQSILVHGMLLQLLAYVNPICNHVLTNIDLTGFDASNVPVPTVIPPAPVITKMAEGKAAGTYKVFLQKKKKRILITARVAMQHKGTRYTAQYSAASTGPWTTLIEGVASTKIIFSGLPAGKSYVHVYGVNSAGKGQPSAPFPFTPQ